MGEKDEGMLRFAQDFYQGVLARTEADGDQSFYEDALTQTFIDYLADAGELDDALVCRHHARGIQVNGYAFGGSDETNDVDSLDIIVVAGFKEHPPQTLTKTEMNATFKKAVNFLLSSTKGYHRDLEESTDVFDLSQRIQEMARYLTRIRFFLFTDGVCSVAPPLDEDHERYRVSYHVWDMERLYRCVSSGRKREIVEVDFVESLGSEIPCLMQPSESNYTTYLAIFPGAAIADLYGKYGSRLLERNVRSFLQAKGKINAGIRRTIRQEPDMFLAFNNGLSITAESVELADLPGGGTGIRAIRDLQIVNGGQTTASIYYAAKRDKADISSVAVQAKITVINDSSLIDEIVPKISAYANSQNKIQAADLEANNVYHRRLEALSREIWAPARDGASRQTRWYYERARGQFQDEQNRQGTPSKQKDFLAVHPKTQMFTKTDLAKFLYTWDQSPHIVSRGAQTCFNSFTSGLGAHVHREGNIDERYFQRLIATAILFRSAEHIIRDCGFSGYRANLVTYTLARIARDTKGKVDLYRIFKEQRISPAMEAAITEVARHVWDHITNPPGNGNVTQYCKKEDCWLSFLNVAVPFPQALHKELFGGAGASPRQSGPQGVTIPIATGGAGQEVKRVTAIEPKTWFALVEWSTRTGHLTGLQRKIASDMALLIGYGQLPSRQQALEGLQVYDEASRLGFAG